MGAGEGCGGGRGADPSPGAPRTSVHTRRIQRQPQLIGVHGSRGVLVELIECGLGREVWVSPTPRSQSTHKKAESGPEFPPVSFLPVPYGVNILTLHIRCHFWSLEISLGFYPAGPVVKTPALPLHGAWVQSLVPGQGPRIPHAMRHGQK